MPIIKGAAAPKKKTAKKKTAKKKKSPEYLPKHVSYSHSDTLEIYLGMFGQLAGQIKNNISNIDAASKNTVSGLTLTSLRHINSLQPNPELNIVIEWFSASIKYDFFLIAAEFIMNDEIAVDESQINIVTSSLKKAITDFGVYTLLSGLWQPKIEDETQLIRNIKIKAAAYRMNTGLGKSISLHYLQNLLAS